MFQVIKSFAKSEDGAVTVDWVVLTGGILLAGVLVVGSIASGATTSSGAVGNALGSAVVPTVVFN